jgi:hypothetical protein
MISRAGFGLAGLLTLAAATAIDCGAAKAQFAPSRQTLPLAQQPVLSAPPTDPWASERRAIEQGASEGTESQAKEDEPAKEKAKDEAQGKEEAAETEAAANSDSPNPDKADIANLELDWSQLDVDASTLTATSPASKARVSPRNAATGDMTWSSQERPNGSAVSVKQPISPFWDTRIGADMTIVRQPATLSELLAEKATNGGNEPQSSGTAWAAVTAPGVGSIWDKTAVEARLDPSQDQGKLGTSLSKSLALGEQYSLTLQNGYNLVQQGLAHSYETEQSARLSITDSGTSFSAGQTLSTADDKWLRKIGAEQKIVGGFTISGSVAETTLGPSNKSISAGFKQSW